VLKITIQYIRNKARPKDSLNEQQHRFEKKKSKETQTTEWQMQIFDEGVCPTKIKTISKRKIRNGSDTEDCNDINRLG
jgi:hypothetical protein